ncbi:MAG TPA: hypothetical protein VNL94_06195, partial [Candidatus Binatia bacterium]|nr:hypothetical protein [Candidatus Binatia bacterium]
MFQRRLAGFVAVAALVAAACGGGASPAPTGGGQATPAPTQGGTATEPPGATQAPPVDIITSIGEPEGELNLVIWGGYA